MQKNKLWYFLFAVLHLRHENGSNHGRQQGIGLSLTSELSKRFMVYALCRSEFPKEYLNNNVRVFKVDVTNKASISDFVERMEDTGVAIDLLINNAEY